MGRAKRKVFRPIFGRDITSSSGRRTQERIDNEFRAAQELYDINAEKYRDSAIRSLGDSLEGLNEAEKQILIDKAIADIMPKEENPFADISSNPDAQGAIQKDEERQKEKGDDYGLLDKAEVWMNASMNKLFANATQSIKAGSDVIRGASDYFFSGNDVSPNYMLSEAVEREGKGALYNIFGAGNRYLANTAESAERAIHGAEKSLASRGMDSGFWHAASDMVGQWGFTYGGMATAALGRLGGAFSGLGSFAKSTTAAARWAKASEYTRKMFSASSLFYGALSEAAIESYGVSKALEEGKKGQLDQLMAMMQKDFDQDFYSYERKYGAMKFSDFTDIIMAKSHLDPRLKREIAGVLSGQVKNPSYAAAKAAEAVVAEYKNHAEKAILQNASDEIDQRNGLAAGWTAGLNTVLLTFMNKYTYELATDKLAGANRMKKAGRLGALGSTLINASAEGIEEVVQGGISKGAENIGKRSVDEMLRASTISERNSTSIGILGSIGEIGKGMWDTTLSGSAWTDEALPAIVSTLLIPMYKGSKFANDSHRTDAFGDARQKKKSWLSGIGSLYDSSPIGFSGVERYRDYKYSGGKQRTSDEAIEAMTKIIKGKHDDLTNEEKRVMTEVFGQNYAEVVHETYQSVVDAMASADRMNALLAQVAQTSSDSAETAAAEELTKAHNVATMLGVIYNSSIGQANFSKRNFGQWTSDMMRSTREFGADMGHAISSFFGANTDEKEARYQAAVAKREADRAAREEARRSESDPFAEVPDNLRPFLNFLDVKETDEATLVSIARQRIENTLDPEEKKKMEEAYFQGEGSDKLTEKAIKDIAGEINKQKHALADIATDYSKTMYFLNLTTKAGEFSGREKSRIAAAAASFNHLRRLASEHMDAFEEELSGIYNEISEAAKNRMTELLKDREAMRDNLNTDDEQKKSILEANIKAINKEIEALEKRMRAIEEAQKKKEDAPKSDFSNTLGGWDEFMKRFNAFDELNNAYGEAAVTSGNDELAKKLAELTLVDESRPQSGALAIKFAREAMNGIESLNKLLTDKKARESLTANAARNEEAQARREGEEIINSGETFQNADEAANAAAENGATDVASAIRQGAQEAQDKGEGESGLSKYKSAVHDAIMKTLSENEKFMQILHSYGIEGRDATELIKNIIDYVSLSIKEKSDGAYTDYKDAMKSDLLDLRGKMTSAIVFLGIESEELMNSIAEWVANNMDQFPDNPMAEEGSLPGNPSQPNGEHRIDSIKFDAALQNDVASVSSGGVTILNSSVADELNRVFGSSNALINSIANGDTTMTTSISFANGRATIEVFFKTNHGDFTLSMSLSHDELNNRLQDGVSLSTLAREIVSAMVVENEKDIKRYLNEMADQYSKEKERVDKEQAKTDDPTPATHPNDPVPEENRTKVLEGGSTTLPAGPGSGTTDLTPIKSLTLWDEYNTKLAKNDPIPEEWKRWYADNHVEVNLKNAKGKEVFFGFAEELSENGDVGNSPLVVYVKDEHDQFIPIGMLPVQTSGNTQALINNARALATEDKKFNIFSSSDLKAPKTTVSKIKYSPFDNNRIPGDDSTNAHGIINGVEEELKRDQVAISVTAFPGENGKLTLRTTTHNQSLYDANKEEIEKVLREKEVDGFLQNNYGQTYLIVVINGKDGPKPLPVGLRGNHSFAELIQGKTNADDQTTRLANEYMEELTKRFNEAIAQPNGGVGVTISGGLGQKYVEAFGDNFVSSITILDGSKLEISFSPRLHESSPALKETVDFKQGSKSTTEALGDSIVEAMGKLNIGLRRVAVAKSLMGDKEKVEAFIKEGMRMTQVRNEAGFEALSESAPEEGGKGNEEGNKEGTTSPTPPQGPTARTALVDTSATDDGPFGGTSSESVDKIKDNLANSLAGEGYSIVVKSSTSPHIAAVQAGRIYMFEVDPVSGTHKRFEWNQMQDTLKADTFALINSALSADFKNSEKGRLLRYGDELSGTTHTIVVRRSTKGISTGNKEKSSGSNADKVISLVGKDKHEILEAVKTTATLRGLVLELAAKGVTAGTPVYFSKHTINGKTYGGGHKVVLQAKDENGKVHEVEVEIDDDLGAQMDKIASLVRDMSVKKLSEGFAMISDVKMVDINSINANDPNSGRTLGEADIVFFRDNEGKAEVIVSDIKSTEIATEDSSPLNKIQRKNNDGEFLIDKYKKQVEGYQNHLNSLGISTVAPGYLIAVGYSILRNAVVVESGGFEAKKGSQGRTGKNAKRGSKRQDFEGQDREALLPFERGDIYQEVHEVARLLPQGSLYQALRIYTGVAEVAPGVWGRYRDGIIEVASGASAGTLYHEAMHFIYEKLLTDADRGMLVSGLSEVTEEQIREIFGNQIPIAYARDVQELSAELFRLWMQTKGDKKARKALEEKITRLAPKKRGFWGRLQALWERIKAALGYTPTSSIVSILTGIEGGNYSHVSVASRVNATNLSSPIEGAVESMLRYGLMSEEDFNNAYDPSSVLASRNIAQLVAQRFMDIAYDSLSVLEEGLDETEHAGRVRRREATFDDAVAVLRDAAANSEDAMRAVEIVDELGLNSNTKTIQEMDALEERTDNLFGQLYHGCK